LILKRNSSEDIPAILDQEKVFPSQVKLVCHRYPIVHNLDSESKHNKRTL
jgi:hypothetical protein